MSSWKRHTYSTYRELESLDEDQWNDFVGITDDQAIQSDIGGDSDADDCFDESFSTSTLSTRSRNQGSYSGTSSSSQPPQEFLFLPPSPPMQSPPSPPSQPLPPNPTKYHEIISPEDAAPRENIIHKDLKSNRYATQCQQTLNITEEELIGDTKQPLLPFRENKVSDHKLMKSSKKNLRRCRYCSTASKPKRCVYECVQCDVALCV